MESSVPLESGTSRVELRYRQSGGPAFLVLDWDTPSLLEALPLEAHLSGDAAALDGASLRYWALTSWILVVLALSWVSAVSYAAVRASQSKRAWGAALRGWWHQPPSDAPVPLVRPRAWALTAAVLAALGVVTRLVAAGRIERLSQEFAVNPRRSPFVLERIETFPSFLLVLAVLCLVVGLLLRTFGPRAATGARLHWRWWLLAAISAALLWGVWISQDEWVRYGRPCYDGYCDYAEHVRRVMLRPGADTWQALRFHLGENYHANSPVGPVLIAGLSLLGPGIVSSFRILSAIATLGTLSLLVRIGRRDLGLAETPALIAAFLFAACGSVQRSLLFPQTDALAMFFFTLSVERLLALRRSFTFERSLLAVLAITVALLSKLSALPLLGIAAAVVLWPVEGERSRSNENPRALARRIAVPALRAGAVVVPPLALVLAYVLALQTTNNVRTELHRIASIDSRLTFHLVAALVTLIPFFLAVSMTLRRRWSATEAALVASVAIYLVGLWSSRASGWERFYLNAMPLALPLAVGRLRLFPELNAPLQVAILLAAYTTAHAVRMLLHLYNGA